MTDTNGTTNGDSNNSTLTDKPETSQDGLSIGATAGIVIAILIILPSIITLLWWLSQRSKNGDDKTASSPNPEGSPLMARSWFGGKTRKPRPPEPKFIEEARLAPQRDPNAMFAPSNARYANP